MKAIRWTLITLLGTCLLYVSVFYLACKIKYNNLPIVYLWSDYFSSNGGPTHLKSIEWDKACSHYQNWDVVLLGASRAERGYDPAFFAQNGIQFFNCGTSAQSMENAAILADNILASACQVKEIWIDIHPASFKDGALESTADLIQNIGFIQAPYEIAVQSRDFRALNLLMKRWFCPNGTVALGAARYNALGFVSVDKKLPQDLTDQIPTFKPYASSDFYPGEKSMLALKKIIGLCKQKNVGLKFIISPVSIFNSEVDLNRMLQAIEPIAAANQIEVINFAHLSTIHTSDHFYDEKHLNTIGVAVFNQALLDTIDKK
jgi:hypothetical protein